MLSYGGTVTFFSERTFTAMEMEPAIGLLFSALSKESSHMNRQYEKRSVTGRNFTFMAFILAASISIVSMYEPG